MLKKVINSLRFSWNGLKITWREEHNFRIEIFAAILVLFCMFYFDFTFVEAALCIIGIIMVLCAEIINTAIEDLCNKVEPNQDLVMAKIKDVTASFVLVTGLGAALLGILVFYNHFF